MKSSRREAQPIPKVRRARQGARSRAQAGRQSGQEGCSARGVQAAAARQQRQNGPDHARGCKVSKE